MAVLFNNEIEEQSVENSYELLEKAIDETLYELNISEPVEVSVTITNSSNIKELNNEYRQNDSITDVLSFPMFEAERPLTNKDIKNQKIYGHEVLIGDIVICYERAVEQAKDYGHSLERELSFLTVHSMLHLLGYDHMTQEDEKLMFSLQEKILIKMGLSREENHV